MPTETCIAPSVPSAISRRRGQLIIAYNKIEEALSMVEPGVGSFLHDVTGSKESAVALQLFADPDGQSQESRVGLLRALFGE